MISDFRSAYYMSPSMRREDRIMYIRELLLMT